MDGAGPLIVIVPVAEAPPVTADGVMVTLVGVAGMIVKPAL